MANGSKQRNHQQKGAINKEIEEATHKHTLGFSKSNGGDSFLTTNHYNN
jgi:hypothetical protein